MAVTIQIQTLAHVFAANSGGTVFLGTFRQNQAVSQTFNIRGTAGTTTMTALSLTGDCTVLATLGMPIDVVTPADVPFSFDLKTNACGQRSVALSITGNQTPTPFTTTFTFNVVPGNSRAPIMAGAVEDFSSDS